MRSGCKSRLRVIISFYFYAYYGSIQQQRGHAQMTLRGSCQVTLDQQHRLCPAHPLSVYHVYDQNSSVEMVVRDNEAIKEKKKKFCSFRSKTIFSACIWLNYSRQEFAVPLVHSLRLFSFPVQVFVLWGDSVLSWRPREACSSRSGVRLSWKRMRGVADVCL